MDYSLGSEISGFAFNENLTETKGLMGDLETELASLRSWRQNEQDALMEEMAKNRTNTEARFKEKARKEKEADDQEEAMLKEQMLMNEVNLSERFQNIYSNYRPNNFDGLRIEKTGIRNTEAITHQINQGEQRVENLKNFGS